MIQTYTKTLSCSTQTGIYQLRRAVRMNPFPPGILDLGEGITVLDCGGYSVLTE